MTAGAERPWKAVPFDDGGIRDANNHAVCMVDGLEERDIIVTAVNAYDKLKADNEALVHALALLETAARRYMEGLDIQPNYCDRMCEKARATLEAARGEVMSNKRRKIGSKAWWDGSFNGNRTPSSDLAAEVEIIGYSEYSYFHPEGEYFRYKVKAEGFIGELMLYEFELQDSKPVEDAPQVEE